VDGSGTIEAAEVKQGLVDVSSLFIFLYLSRRPLVSSFISLSSYFFSCVVQMGYPSTKMTDGKMVSFFQRVCMHVTSLLLIVHISTFVSSFMSVPVSMYADRRGEVHDGVC
jgi:hypothetical protein